MKIVVDADACPVKETIVRLAKQHEIPVVFVVSTASFTSTGIGMSRKSWSIHGHRL